MLDDLVVADEAEVDRSERLVRLVAAVGLVLRLVAVVLVVLVVLVVPARIIERGFAGPSEDQLAGGSAFLVPSY